MKKIFVWLLVAVGTATLARGEAVAQVEQEVIALHRAWGEARIKGDSEFLEKFYGHELMINQMNGAVVSRTDDIALFAGRKIMPESINDVDLTVAVYGAIAVVSGRENLRGTYKGNTGEVALRFTSVLVQRDGRWQLVAYQATEIRAKK